MNIKYRADIDGLRAIAVLSVVFYHFSPSLLQGGFVGVDIFFVISGYLISAIIINDASHGKFSYREFYKKRILRIFPALFLVLACCVIVGWFYVTQEDYRTIGKHIAGGAFFVSNLLSWSELGYFDASSSLKPLLHLWSLSVEEQFYIIFPTLILFLMKRKLGLWKGCIGIFIISFIYCILTMNDIGGANYFSPLSRCWELMAGTLIAIYYTDKRLSTIPKIIKHSLSIIGLIMLVISFFFINEKMNFPGYIALIPVIGTSLIIIAGENSVLNKNLLSLKPVVYIGLISYPLYLWHWPIYSYFRIITASIPSNIQLILMLVISLALASFTYYCVEKPIRFGIVRKFDRPSNYIAAMVFLIGFFGLYIYTSKGVENREVNRIAEEYSSITNPYEYFDYPSLMRSGKCHSVDLTEYKRNGCISDNRNSIFIWGDSYAASLYSGIKNYITEKNIDYHISQMTDGNAPPFFNDGLADSKENLKTINSKRLEEVSEVNPSIVVIAWKFDGINAYPDKNKTVNELMITISKIRNVSKKSRIIVIGPFPEWQDSLIKQVIGFYKKNHAPPSFYMSSGLRNVVFEWDAFLNEKMRENGVEYLSAIKSMCRDGGCISRFGDGPKNLSAVDFGHLTENGSVYLINKLGNDIFIHDKQDTE